MYMYRRNNFGIIDHPFEGGLSQRLINQIKELNSALVKKQSQVTTLQSHLQDRMIGQEHKPLISSRLRVAQEELENIQERLEIAKKKLIEFQRKPQSSTSFAPPPFAPPEYIPKPTQSMPSQSGKKDEGEVSYFMLGQEEAQSGLPFRKQFYVQKGLPQRLSKGVWQPAGSDKTIGLEEYTQGYTAFIKDGKFSNDYYEVQDKGYSSQWAKQHLATHFPTEVDLINLMTQGSVNTFPTDQEQTELSSDEKGLFDDPLIFWGGIGVLGLIIFKFAKKKEG